MSTTAYEYLIDCTERAVEQYDSGDAVGAVNDFVDNLRKREDTAHVATVQHVECILAATGRGTGAIKHDLASVLMWFSIPEPRS